MGREDRQVPEDAASPFRSGHGGKAGLLGSAVG